MLEPLNAAWNHIFPCEVTLEKVYYNTSEINLFPAVEMIILNTVEFHCGAEGFINIAYPFSSLENIRSLLTEDRFIRRRYGGREPSSKSEEKNSVTIPESRYHLYYEYPLKGVTLRQFLDASDKLELSLDPELKGKRLCKPVEEDYGR
jgi:flagellar motor switch protein FliM